MSRRQSDPSIYNYIGGRRGGGGGGVGGGEGQKHMFAPVDKNMGASVTSAASGVTRQKNNKTYGVDNVINEFMKYYPDVLLLVTLTKMLNLVLDSDIVPTNWCIGMIKPL